MAASERAYTAEYSYLGHAYAEAYPERYPQSPGVKRTREKPQPERQKEDTARQRAVERESETPLITRTLLFKMILLLIFAGTILISTIWMSAKATEIKYEINKINNANVLLQNEISMLDIKIESANSIEQIEDYATGTLNMQYPKAQQCIYVEEGSKASDDLVQRIREKAYGE